MWVCFPGLHISLGIFKRIWVILEDSCTRLDLMLAERVTSGNFRGSFQKYVSALSDTVKLKDELERLTYSARLNVRSSVDLRHSKQSHSFCYGSSEECNRESHLSESKGHCCCKYKRSVTLQLLYNVTTFREMKSRNWKQLLQKNVHLRMDHSSTP